MEIISRAEAKAKGLTRYFTGKPCCRGHVCGRKVGCSSCVECSNETRREYRKANPKKNREYCRKYRAANPEKFREYCRKYRAANIEKYKERSLKYREANPEKEKERGYKFREKAKRNESALNTLALLANLSKLKEIDNQ